MIVQDITNDIEILSATDFYDECDLLLKKNGMICTGVSCIDLLEFEGFKSKNNISDKRYLIIYHFNNLENNQRRHLAVALVQGQTLQSQHKKWNSAFYFEKKIAENYGITFYSDEVIQKEVVGLDSSKYVLSKDYIERSKEQTNIDEVKPTFLHEEVQFYIKPSSRGENIKLTAQVKADACLRMNVEKRYGAGQFEKNFESKYVDELIDMFDGEDQELYKMLWLETSDYVNARKSISMQDKMIFIELMRSKDICNLLINTFSAINEFEMIKCLDGLKNRLCSMLEALDLKAQEAPGNVFTPSVAWRNDCINLVKDFTPILIELFEAVSRMPRLVELLHVKAKRINILNSGFSSIPLRGFGVNFDLRKHADFCYYKELDINPALGISGSCYDRVLISINELKESFSIIVRLLESYIQEDMAEVNTRGFGERILFSYAECINGEVNILTSLKNDGKIYSVNFMMPSLRMLKTFEQLFDSFNPLNVELSWNSLGMKESELSI